MEDLAQTVINAGLAAGASFVDVRIENSMTTVFEITNGVTKIAQNAKIKGAGTRAFINGAWAFAHTSDLTRKGMKKIGEGVAQMALATSERVAERFEIDGPSFKDKIKLSVKKPLTDVSPEEKITFVKMIDEQTRAYDKRIINSRTVYSDVWTQLYVANSLGTSVRMEYSLPRIVVLPTAKDGVNRQRTHKSKGYQGGFEKMELPETQQIGELAAELVIELLSSEAIKGGIYDIVLDPYLNGVLVHESFGHACEADNFRAKTTVLEGKLNERLGAEFLNLSDDPTLSDARATFKYDWEGTKTQKHYLVKNGILNELLHTLETASYLNMAPNGAARAQSFKHEPIPRMSNTFMEPGNWDVDELIADTREGLVLCDFNYGYTDSSKGQFMFQANYGYKIEDGEKGQIIRDVSIAGLLLEALEKIDAVCNDFELTSGTCGKAGQSVPDYSGGPHARIREFPVGGM